MAWIARAAYLFLIIPAHTAVASDDPAATEFFEKEIRPLLAGKCWSCHGPEKAKDHLRLDSRTAALAGGDLGPAMVPGNAAESLIVQAVHYDDLLKMPPKGKLAEAEIQALEKWIDSGAAWPATKSSPASASATPSPFNLKERAAHWSFQPLHDARPPAVRHAAWPRTPIDNFIQDELEKNDIEPAEQADRATLIRRLTFDLLGLPPTIDEIRTFLNDPRSDAYERLVDRLLASPHYGERWGRHWLDLVRYVETSGHEFDYDIPQAWRYRDYVIRALNDDVPYDRFVQEHVAGDLLTPPRIDPANGRNESTLAPAFYWFNDGTHSPVDVRDEQTRRIDNQIDVMGKAFLGLTVACARCHDHKFDPIRQTDYYALAGFLKSSRYSLVDLSESAVSQERARRLRQNGREIVGALMLAQTTRRQETTGADVFTSFNEHEFKKWTPAGLAFANGPSANGDAHIAANGRVVMVPAGIAHSALADERLQGVLRSPTFTIDKRYIHSLAAGRSGRVQVVIDGFEKVRDPIYGGLSKVVEHGNELRWVSQDVSMWQGHRAYIELIDGGMPDFSTGTVQVGQGDGYIAVDEIRFSDSREPPTNGALPVVAADAHTRPEAAALLAERDRLRAELPQAELALSMADGTGEDEFLLLRGSARTPSELVPRGFLEVFRSGSEAAPPAGSGRLELAAQLTENAQPIFARVAVNRMWQHLLGRGLVSTPDDFGHMGQLPSHPELLDWLAEEFIASGYSQKHVLRLILCSRVYQMSARSDNSALVVDPDNRLFHSARVRRLEAESIRDAILAVSGRLDRRPYGPSEPVYLTEFMEGRGRPPASGPLDGAGRRSIYQNMRRNFLPPFLLAFDLPTPASTIGRRNVSNVPAQALSLLNDPFVMEQARAWARRVLGEPVASDAQRVDQLYLEAFGRSPSDVERSRALAFLDSQAGIDRTGAWTRMCHVLFNVKEFVFIP